jgi:hypothetical protein
LRTSHGGVICYSASSERKLLLHKLICIVLCCDAVIAPYIAHEEVVFS